MSKTKKNVAQRDVVGLLGVRIVQVKAGREVDTRRPQVGRKKGFGDQRF